MVCVFVLRLLLLSVATTEMELLPAAKVMVLLHEVVPVAAIPLTVIKEIPLVSLAVPLTTKLELLKVCPLELGAEIVRVGAVVSALDPGLGDTVGRGAGAGVGLAVVFTTVIPTPFISAGLQPTNVVAPTRMKRGFSVKPENVQRLSPILTEYANPMGCECVRCDSSEESVDFKSSSYFDFANHFSHRYPQSLKH